jgi:hypothetical protein
VQLRANNNVVGRASLLKTIFLHEMSFFACFSFNDGKWVNNLKKRPGAASPDDANAVFSMTFQLFPGDPRRANAILFSLERSPNAHVWKITASFYCSLSSPQREHDENDRTTKLPFFLASFLVSPLRLRLFTFLRYSTMRVS